MYLIPKHLNILDISLLLKESPTSVREKCINGDIKGFQDSDNPMFWHIETEQFFKHPKWEDFIQKRVNLIKKTISLAEKTNLKILEEDV